MASFGEQFAVGMSLTFAEEVFIPGRWNGREGGVNGMEVTLAAIEDARMRIAGSALRTPLIRLN